MTKRQLLSPSVIWVLAERQGFEPWIGYKPMPVFKTGAFNRSATSPEMGAAY